VKESPWSRPDTQRPPVHVTVICAGPMSADVISQEDSPERIQRLIFNRDVHLVLTDAQEEWLVDCNRLETVFSVPEENRGPGGGAESGSSGAELRQLLATGDVRTSGSRFELYCDELSIKPNETGGRTAVASGTRKRIIVKGGAGVMPGAGLSSSKGGTGGDMEVFCGADVVFTQGGSRPDSIRGSSCGATRARYSATNSRSTCPRLRWPGAASWSRCGLTAGPRSCGRASRRPG
jgi:hypothetical protein